jgi:uncharacterized Zn ribbon protein
VPGSPNLESGEVALTIAVRDSKGRKLQDGDNVTLVKDIGVKGLMLRAEFLSKA